MSENNNKVTSPPDQTDGLQHAGRRQFLKTLATGSAVAGVAAVTASQAIAAASPDTDQQPATEEQNGYRETDHIRTFYDTLR
ncbi:twin-arginine translocation signal domain-containing protein [Oceanospirillum sp.]|uniref:twin-arginine translocation signal domain-containing protein n=1 Tax=Oceanospirillum sp. TaxID=2021254 RepID=UPI003A959771